MFIYTISDIMQLLSVIAVISILAWLRIDKYLRGGDDRE